MRYSQGLMSQNITLEQSAHTTFNGKKKMAVWTCDVSLFSHQKLRSREPRLLFHTESKYLPLDSH